MIEAVSFLGSTWARIDQKDTRRGTPADELSRVWRSGTVQFYLLNDLAELELCVQLMLGPLFYRSKAQ